MTTSKNILSWRRYLSLRYISHKVREKGIVGATLAILRKWSILKPILKIIDNIWYKGKKQPNVLYAFFDLEVSPATFDILTFLPLAELARKNAGCDSLHVVIVPGPNGGFRARDLPEYRELGAGDYDIESMRWRLRNILVPCCWLIPSCQQVTVCTSRKEAHAFQSSLVKYIFPKGYSVHFPIEKHLLRHFVNAASKEGVVLPSLQATQQALRFVSDWIQPRANGRKVITITLRECSYELYRNSDLKAWGAFARSLDPSIYCPVVIRDTESAFKPLPSELHRLLVFPEVPWNVELRVALYELSYLNMTVSGGPCALCIYNQRVRYLIFKMLTPSCRADSARFFRSEGLEPGSQLKHATPFQHLVWEDDRLEVIQKKFSEMCDSIEMEEHKN